MCGIVGLFIKERSLEPELGQHLSSMLAVMTDRGPNSAGFAIYTGGSARDLKFTLRASENFDWDILERALIQICDNIRIRVCDTHAVLSFDPNFEAEIRSTIKAIAPDISIVGSGFKMEIYKEVGLPIEVAKRFQLEKMRGTHAIGHTRMATESAVTTSGAHPFSTGRDQCLVHNGSLSNHNSVRRSLIREGLRFETDNDSEVAAGFLTAQIHKGMQLSEALEACLREIDGFYTFVVGTASGFGVLRDAIACKPAIMAETGSYVAFGTEYRALAALPDINTARIWEPEPQRVYFWERN